MPLVYDVDSARNDIVVGVSVYLYDVHFSKVSECKEGALPRTPSWHIEMICSIRNAG